MSVRHVLPALAIVLVACSGASSSDLFDGDPSESASPTDPAPANDDAPASGGSAAAAPSGPGTPAAPTGPAPSSSSPPSGSSAPPPAAPPPPAGDCTNEIEPDDSLGQATPFTQGFCGKIDAKNDVDFGAIAAPMTATKMKYTIASKDGTVAHHFFMNGMLAITDPSGAIKVVPGATYAVELLLANGSPATARPTYRVDVTFE